MESPKFKVLVRCFTYNHSKFITDALNGFTMQQTDFPFICTIVDDASTDGEQEVIRNYVEDNFDFSEGSVAYNKETSYAHITYAQHKTNKNCFFAVLYLKENHYSQRKSKLQYLQEWREQCEYEALCEGDDYWIDSYKLGKQYSFLINNKEYSMCFHNALELKKTINNASLFSNIQDMDYSKVDIYRNWIIPTASVMYNLSIFEIDFLFQALKNKNFAYGDIVLFLSCAKYGKIRGMSDVMSVYRRHNGGITYNLSYNNIYKNIAHNNEIWRLFGRDLKSISNKKNSFECFTLMKLLLKEKNIPKSIYFMILSIMYSPIVFVNRLFRYINGFFK